MPRPQNVPETSGEELGGEPGEHQPCNEMRGQLSAYRWVGCNETKGR
jgi:hypothetical protein